MKEPTSELSPEANGDLFCFPCSYAQQRLWFLDQFERTSTNYNIGIGVRLIGKLNVEALDHTLSEVVRRHESLRTTFAEVDGEPMQMVSTEGKFELEQDDLTGVPADERQSALERLAREVAQLPFNLKVGPLFRCRLVRMAEDEHVALLTMHHIVSDGWSLGVLVREVSTLYDAYVRGMESPLKELPVQYGDYSVWQREWLQGEVLEQQLDYWRKQLADLQVLEVPSDYPRPKEPTGSGARCHFHIEAELSERLRELARTEGVTLFMVLLAGFVMLLRRYTGERDLAVGTPVANRTRGEVESLIGFFVNTLVLRVEVTGEENFRELLQRVKEVCLGAYAHQDVPFERVVEELNPERGLGRTPLFQVLFALQNASRTAGGARLQLPELELEPMEVYNQTTQYELSVTLFEGEEGLSGSAEYSTDIFAEASIARMLDHYVRLLDAAATAPEQRVRSLPLLSETEREQLLFGWNTPPLESTGAASVTALFEAEARRRGSTIAVRAGEEELTYGELNARANQLAAHLRRLGVRAEKLVGIYVERSVGMVTAMLAVLKAGGAYVPLDPGYPVERLRYMVENAGVELVIRGARGSKISEGVQELYLSECAAELAQYSKEDVKHEVQPEQLAYVIYTSGSTGRPKGVMIHHSSLTNFVRAVARLHQISPSDRLLQFASISFDVSAEEIYCSLISGACLVLRNDEMLGSIDEFLRQCAAQGITVLDLPTAYWHELVASGGARQLPESIRLVIIGGEKALPQRVSQWRDEASPSVRLINAYGPTEATVSATASELSDDIGPLNREVAIGRALDNVELYVLDDWQRLVPAGVTGELYIGGGGLARGYLNRPEETAQRFVPHPFSARAGQRLYRTGDMVRFRADGQLEYVGRRDQQVKLRGFRIEPGEIESVLASHSAIKEAVVMLKAGPSGNQLVAYLGARERPTSINELREWMKRQLPDYMVPSAFVWLDELPLTTSGKIDRRALDALEIPETPNETSISPRTELEKLMAGVWAELLGVERVGLSDNFFDLGGHSLLATQVLSRLRAALGIELSLRSLFDSPTVAALAAQAETELRPAQSLPITPARERASSDNGLPLSFAQERLYFMHLLAPGDTAYNLATALRLSGHLDLDALERSMTEIAHRHESLRTTFTQVDGRPLQLISEASTIKIALRDLSSVADQERDEEVRRLSHEEARLPFNLSAGPLWRILLFRLQPEEHVLLLTMHHIVTDGWSFGIFARELVALYQAFSQNKPSPLPELPIQYADFAVWQRDWLRGEVLDQQLDYWCGQLAGAPPVLKLPLDHARPVTPSSRGARVSFQLELETTRALQQLSRHAGVTLFMTLLAAFKMLLQRHTGQEDIVVGADIANRNRTETEGLIGFFVNMLVLRTDLSGDPTFLELLARVREVALGAYAHQDLPFAKLVDELQIPRDLTHNPLFQVVFVLQNAPVEEAIVPGLNIVALPLETEAVPFDMVLSMWEGKEGLVGSLLYRTDLFERATAERLIKHLRNLLEAVVKDPEEHLSKLSLLAEEDVRQYFPETVGGLNLSQKELEGVILELQRASAE